MAFDGRREAASGSAGMQTGIFFGSVLIRNFWSAAVPAAADGNDKAIEIYGIRFEFRVLRVRTPALRFN
jgi:hypothetical protein